MSKYEPLEHFLTSQGAEQTPMTFAQIERVLGMELPHSAHEYPAWWSNEAKGHVQARAWLRAGYKTEQVDLAAKRVTFRKVREQKARAATHGDRHPAFGALKGTFTIQPGWDITRPAADADDLSGMDASLERTADIVQQALPGKKT